MNKGFISTIALIFMMNTIVLSTALLTKCNTEMKIISRMKEVNRIISKEAILIQTINCALKNDTIDEIHEILDEPVIITIIDQRTLEIKWINSQIIYLLLLNEDKSRINTLELQ